MSFSTYLWTYMAIFHIWFQGKKERVVNKREERMRMRMKMNRYQGTCLVCC